MCYVCIVTLSVTNYKGSYAHPDDGKKKGGTSFVHFSAYFNLRT